MYRSWGHPLQGRPHVPPATSTSRILTASVSHLFLLLLRSSGSLPWPRDLPFHLVPTLGRGRETSLLLPILLPVLFLKIDQSPGTLVLPLPSFHKPGLLLSLSKDSWPLQCAYPDLWVVECQCTHVAKELNLLDALALQIAQSSQKLPGINTVSCMFSPLLTLLSKTQSFGSELMGQFELCIAKGTEYSLPPLLSGKAFIVDRSNLHPK